MENIDAIWHQIAMSTSDKFPSDAADRFQVRMPPGLRERIAEAAKENERSMNAEIVATLTRAYPASTRASDIVTDLYNTILFHDNKLSENDRPVIHEMFEALGRQIYLLEKYVSDEASAEKDSETDAVLTVKDPDTGKEKKFVVEYKNSINHKDFAVSQLEKYLRDNPDYSGGIIVIGDERLKAAR